jgi:hypothetical protein
MPLSCTDEPADSSQTQGILVRDIVDLATGEEGVMRMLPPDAFECAFGVGHLPIAKSLLSAL